MWKKLKLKKTTIVSPVQEGISALSLLRQPLYWNEGAITLTAFTLVEFVTVDLTALQYIQYNDIAVNIMGFPIQGLGNISV